MKEMLILVDEDDNELAVMDKLSVHKSGLLHRAFSVFIFNSKEQLLLQQRADKKYHSPGLWSNTCCSHPSKGEKVFEAVNRRLAEEMGMECDTTFAFSFIYKAKLGNGLTEYEYDHVYIGKSDMQPKPAATEVKDWKYISIQELQEDILKHPSQYTEWLKICLSRVIDCVV